MAKRKKKKKQHFFGKKEFLFNFFSLLAMLAVVLYFGSRSFYYYSKQSMTKKVEAQTLNGSVIQNNPVTDGDGIHQDKEGYYFKGNVSNNYVSFANRIFRIIRINSDNTVKVISDDLNSTFMWGDNKNYQSSNVRNWLEKTNSDFSGVYYRTIPNIKKFLVNTSYSEDILKNDKIVTGKKVYQDMVTTLSIHDYILANGKSSYINNGKSFYLLGFDEQESNLCVLEDGSIQSCDNLEGHGVRSVFTFKSNLAISGGDGTKENPYVISQGEDKNLVGSYVQLGNEKWKVFSDEENILRMQFYGYVIADGVEFFYHYSDYNSLFDLSDKNSLAFLLNQIYLTNLGYTDILLNTDFYIGEISDDAGYSYTNIYSNKVTAKMGLLNIFDYHIVPELEDYYHINTTSEVGSMAYVSLKEGYLKEVDVRDTKHVVPVVSINRGILVSGEGTEANPYVVG